MRLPSGEIDAHSEVVVRPMSALDIEHAFALLQESPQATMWTKESLEEWATSKSAWVAELGGCVAGILLGRVAADEYEILNLAVGQSFRRRRIATSLVNAAMEKARSEGAQDFYLEVRASNEGAIALYLQAGFQICGLRTNYYSDPSEDAMLMNFHNQEKNP